MIYLTGDTHSHFERFSNRRFSAEAGDTVIVCGDFGGLWDSSNEEKYWLKWLSEKPYTILFVDGNHENYSLLYDCPVTEKYGGKVRRVRGNIFHLTRGQVFEIEGFRFFTMGGASTHDYPILDPEASDFALRCRQFRRRKQLYRVVGQTWWAEEMPSEAEKAEGLRNLARYGWKVDIILTHCAPTSVREKLTVKEEDYPYDELNAYLEEIREKCTFRRWYIGHYHQEGTVDERFRLLKEKIVPLNL